MTNTIQANAPVHDQGTEKTPERIKLRLARPHPLISATSYKQDTKTPSGHSLPNDGDGADIRVSRPNFRTALAVLDCLFKALEQRGITIYNERNNYHSKGTYARNNSHDRCQVWLEEKFQRVAHVLTAKEKAETVRYSFYRAQAWDYLPTGVLILHPGGCVDLSTQQAFDSFILQAAGQVMETIEHERSQREYREKVQREEARRAQIKAEEERRVKSLHEAAALLHQHRLLLDYIEEVRRFGRMPPNQTREGQTFEEWLSWAEAQARRMHPLGY